ncbi:Pectinesterase inhibitor domain [Dillenia turbinata]|uniref:pectinesterase n=1 Tax=Dillenia turbinata TaxID=194707 RepID=A0AAN8VVM0_9MAGN
MATTRSKLIFPILVLIFFEFSASLAELSPDILISPETACSLTRYPDYCKSMLPSNSRATMYDYGRFCIDHSISLSRKFLSLINSHLQHSSKLSNPEIQALTDCQFLAELNIDFLITSSNATSNVNATLPIFQADDIHTLLSAVLTNQQTCMDGLEAVSSTDSLHEPLYNGTKLYSVSLALYAKSWVPKTRNATSLKPRRKQLLFRRAGRRLLQLGMDQVNVSSIVVVSQDGSGDYAAISDAVAAAPNNTDGTTGYFLIYVVAGVYEEYVSIAKYQKYIMMIGDGINQTVITGNRSVADGWTTFNCGTFSK